MSAVPKINQCGKLLPMQPEQRIIANWIERTGKARGWSGEEWADRAHVSTSTVTRAVKDNYHSVTTVLTLDKLARAAGVPSVLDWLAADTPAILPNGPTVRAILAGMLKGIPEELPVEERAELMARGLEQALALLARNPAIVGNAPAISVASEALVIVRPDRDKSE